VQAADGRGSGVPPISWECGGRRHRGFAADILTAARPGETLGVAETGLAARSRRLPAGHDDVAEIRNRAAHPRHQPHHLLHIGGPCNNAPHGRERARDTLVAPASIQR